MSIQRYNCYTGYEVISGSLQIECTEFGTWNDTVPICDSKQPNKNQYVMYKLVGKDKK